MNHNGGNGNGDDSGWNVAHGGVTGRMTGLAVPDDDLGWPRRRGGRNARRRGD